VSDALGVEFQSLPLSPEKVLKVWSEKKQNEPANSQKL